MLSTFFRSGGSIGVVGASGAGKTFFAKLLAQRFGARLHVEGVREWLRDRGDLSYEGLPPEVFAEMQLHLLTLFETSQAAIFDTTPLDAVAYVLYREAPLDIPTFRRRARAVLDRIDVFVFFGAFGRFLCADGVRIPDLMHQTEIASRIFLLALEFGLRDRLFIYDHSATTDVNIDRLSSFISEKEKQRDNTV